MTRCDALCHLDSVCPMRVENVRGRPWYGISKSVGVRLIG